MHRRPDGPCCWNNRPLGGGTGIYKFNLSTSYDKKVSYKQERFKEINKMKDLFHMCKHVYKAAEDTVSLM